MPNPYTERPVFMNRFTKSPSMGSVQEKRHRLARILRQEASRSKSDAPLSYGQEALWFLHRASPASMSYHMAMAIRIHSEVDVPALRRACQGLVDRHPVLRTTYPLQDGKPIQRVHGYAPVCFEQVDTSGWSSSQVDAAVIEAHHQPFDLTTGPALRIHLFTHQPTEHVLLLTVHHIAHDGWSLWLIQDELQRLYVADTHGREPALAPMDAPYADFSRWQHQMLSSERGHELEAYWQRQLKGAPTVLDLPTDRPRPPVQSHDGGSHAFTLPRSLGQRLKMLAQTEGVTPYMLLLAAYQTLLHRYTGQDDLLVGSPMSGRTQDKFAASVGYFVNPVVMRAAWRGNPTFRALLAQTKRTVLAALAHQDYPLPLLVQKIAPPRDPSYSPLFQTTFTLQKAQATDGLSQHWEPDNTDKRAQWAGLEVSLYPIAQGEGQFDLELEMIEASSRFFGVFKYRTDLFNPATITRMTDHLKMLLDTVTDDPDQSIDRLPLMTPNEHRMVVRQWNQTEKAYPLDQPLHAWCQAQAQRTPDAVAVVFEGQQLTYQQLDTQANQLAHYLRRQGVGNQTLVGVCMDRSLELVVSLLAVLKAEGAYVPLDPAYPTKRLAFMLQDAAAPVLLTQKHLVDMLPKSDSRVIAVDEHRSQIKRRSVHPPTADVGPDGLAYVIYTSGSTGQPKGVKNTHRGICNRLLWMQDAYGLTPQDRVLQKTPFSFDVSVWEFFWPLMTGATLVVARPNGHKDVAYLMDLVTSQGITTMHFVPPMLSVFLDHPAVEQCESLKRVICSGEALPFDLKERFFEKLDTQLHNLYGPTEAAVDVTAFTCQPASEGERLVVPIGRPVANTTIYILDHHMQPTPIGVPGELHIGGVQVAQGYLNRPELTQQKFVRDPFSQAPDARLYKTADLARWRPDGQIEFLGRLDHQVKIRGFRIELGEIEAALADHPGVREAVVVVQEDPQRGQALVGYVVADSQSLADPSPLRDWLKPILPDHAIPSAFVVLESLPLSPNGKVDRRALPQPRRDQALTQPHQVVPSTATQRKLAEIWSKALGVDRVGLNDNFFDLGGHSLMTAQVISQIHSVFNKELPLSTFIELPTVAAIAGLIDGVSTSEISRAKGTPTLDLRAEVVLDEAIHAGAAKLPATDHPKSILLTGATGFLGVHLLDELLRQTEARVFCLVRCGDAREGRERLDAVMRSYRLSCVDHNDRVVIVPGDLAQPRLGLSQTRWDDLAQRVDMIHHNGAWVNFIYPYAKLKAANVGGTQEVLRLACDQKLKPVHYVSTLSVFSHPDDASEVIGESDPLDRCKGLLDGYAQTKWVAEKILMLSRQRGMLVSCYRPGRITGHSRMGICNTDDLIFRLIKGCVQLGAAPIAQTRIDMTPVDYVAAAAVYLSRQSASIGKAFHLYNPRPAPWDDITQAVGSWGYELQRLSPAQWRDVLLEQTSEASDNALAPLLPMFRGAASFDELAGPELDGQQTLQALQGSGIECPPVDVHLLRRYLSQFVNSGYLHQPPSSYTPDTPDTPPDPSVDTKEVSS